MSETTTAGIAALASDKGMRQVLAELELIQHGNTASYDPKGRSGATDSGGCPPGASFAAHLKWRQLWLEASPGERPAIQRKARDELRSIRTRAHTVTKGETQDELAKRAARLIKQGWTVDQVAQHCRTTPTFVRRAVSRAAVEDAADKQPVVERQHQARAMRSRGLTLRQIALHLGVDAATIHRDLSDERAA